MIKRPWVILIEIIFALVFIVAGVLLWASYYVDTDEFRQDFTLTLEKVLGLPVSLNGELDIALLPDPSLEVFGLVVHNSSLYGNTALASFEKVGVSVRLLPLYSKRIELQRIDIEGMQINIIQSPNGDNNLAQLTERFSSTSPDSSPHDSTSNDAFKVMTLNGIEVSNAAVTYTDLTHNNSMSFEGIDIKTGSIQSGNPVYFTADSNFTWNGGEIDSSIVFKGMVQFNADAGTFQFYEASLNASIGGSFLPKGAQPGEVTSAVSLDWDNRSVSLEHIRLGFLGLRAEGYLRSGNLSKSRSATGQLTIKPFSPLKIIHRFDPQFTPGNNVLERASLQASFDVDQSGFSLSKLAGEVDGIHISGDASLKGYEDPVISASLEADSINLDNYAGISDSQKDEDMTWDSLPLRWFVDLSGSLGLTVGTIHSMGHSFTDTSVSLQGEEGSWIVQASINTEMSSLRGEADIMIDETDAQLPVLSLKGKVDASLSPNELGLMRSQHYSLSGAHSFTLSFQRSPLVCNPHDSISTVINGLKGDMSWKLVDGSGWFTLSEKKQAFSFDTAELSTSFAAKALNADEPHFDINAALHLKNVDAIRSASVSVVGEVGLNIDEGFVTSSGLDVSIGANGTLYGVSSRVQSSGTIIFDFGKGTVSVRKSMNRILGTTIYADVDITRLHNSFSGKGSFNIPNANVRHIIYELSEVTLRTADVSALTEASLQGNVTFNADGFNIRELQGKLDGMAIEGQLSGDRYIDPKINFTLSAGKFDLDRYLPPSDNNNDESDSDNAVDLPLTFLRALNLSGKARFELFKMFDVYIDNLEGSIEADKGKVLISGLDATINEGRVTGQWSGSIGRSELLTRLKLRLSKMDMGGFMENQFQRQYLRGKTDAAFDLTSTGATDEDIVNNLAGTAWLRITDGSYKFSGYNTVINKPEKNSSSVDFYTRSQKEKRTFFSKTTSEMTIKRGVVNIDRFRMEAPPILQAYGEGWISLASNKIDVSIRNDFVAVPSVTVNVKGALSNPEVSFPKGNIVNDTVRNVLSLPEKSFNFLLDIFR